jgi:hypothetical protein
VAKKPVVLNSYENTRGPLSYFTPTASGVDRDGLDGAAGEFTLPNITKTMVLTIEHVPTGYKVEFPAFLTGFSDAYNSEWTSEQVYGRMDPIATFANTRRALSLSWMVPAASAGEASANMDKINAAISFLYPMYTDQAAANKGAIVNMGPLWKIKFGNLVQNAADGEPLMGYVNGLTMDPELDMGMFTIGGAGDSMEYFPKAVRLNLEMVVLHQHSLGWSKDGEVSTLRGGKEGFPYASNQPLTTANSNNLTTAIATADPNSPSNALNTRTMLRGGRPE